MPGPSPGCLRPLGSKSGIGIALHTCGVQGSVPGGEAGWGMWGRRHAKPDLPSLSEAEVGSFVHLPVCLLSYPFHSFLQLSTRPFIHSTLHVATPCPFVHVCMSPPASSLVHSLRGGSSTHTFRHSRCPHPTAWSMRERLCQAPCPAGASFGCQGEPTTASGRGWAATQCQMASVPSEEAFGQGDWSAKAKQ